MCRRTKISSQTLHNSVESLQGFVGVLELFGVVEADQKPFQLYEGGAQVQRVALADSVWVVQPASAALYGYVCMYVGYVCM